MSQPTHLCAPFMYRILLQMFSGVAPRALETSGSEALQCYVFQHTKKRFYTHDFSTPTQKKMYTNDFDFWS